MTARRNSGWSVGSKLRGATLAALTVVLAACGGGGSGDPEPTATLTATPMSQAPTATLVPLDDDRADESLVEAQEHLRNGRYGEAADEYGVVAAAATSRSLRAEAWLGLGVAAFDDGETERALDALRHAVDDAPPGSSVEARAAYLLGLRLNATGQEAEAAGVLGPIVAGGVAGPLANYAQAEYAAAVAAIGQRDEAEAAWETLLATDLPQPLRIDVLRDRADAAVSDGDAAAARTALEEAVALTGDPATRFELAAIALAAGDRDAYLAQLELIVLQSPSSALALVAIAALEEESYPLDSGAVGLVHYRHRDYETAREVLARALEEPDVLPAEVASRTYYYGAAHEDAGLYAEAIPLYDAAVAADPGTNWEHRGQYWAANAAQELGLVEEAARRFQDLAMLGPPGPFSQEAAFLAGYVWYEAGEPQKALDSWEGPGAVAGAEELYWRGRALADLGNQDVATAYFQQAVDIAPRSFYGLEAARFLGKVVGDEGRYIPLEALPRVDWDDVAAWMATFVAGELPAAETRGPEFELASVGLRDEAGALLFARADADPWNQLAAIRDAHVAGLDNTALRLARSLQSDLGLLDEELPLGLLQMVYPLGYPVVLEAEAERQGIDPLLLAALIEQESLWDPGAVSFAAAIGLTQVIEPTGMAIAESLGRDGFTFEELLRPPVAIEFGAFYLAAQLERFGRPEAALAAYNGGPGNVERWQGEGRATPADFVAAVDFGETSNYVERVLSHYAWYRWLYRQ